MRAVESALRIAGNMNEAILALDAIELERERPALYMFRGGTESIPPALVPSEYELVSLPTSRWLEARSVIELDGVLTDRAWADLLGRVLPGGLFVLRHRDSNRLVGTASAIHNPAGSRFYFPAGGSLGYLVVDEAHRGQGLGYALAAAVVERFAAGGYQNLWLGVEGWRLPAIRTYLRAGYRPFLHGPDPDPLMTRWNLIFAAMGLQSAIASWPRDLM